MDISNAMPHGQGHITNYMFVPEGARQTVDEPSEKCSDYYPYGKVLRQYVNSNGPERYLTTQHERDQETGLDYRGARYYDSDVARFLSLDPLAADYASWSAYNYVMGNPISLTDPTGRSATKYETEDRKPIHETKDGSDATVTIANDKVDAFKQELQRLYDRGEGDGLMHQYGLSQKFGVQPSAQANNSQQGTPAPSAQQAGVDGGDLVGPALIALGQDWLKKPRMGIGGGGPSGDMTSVASKSLRWLDKSIQGELGTSVKLPQSALTRALGTRGIGAAAGRLVPVVGWGLTAYEIYTSDTYQSFQAGMHQYYEEKHARNDYSFK